MSAQEEIKKFDSGRHALGLRCEQLGFRFSVRELDELYRDFILLEDNLKTVEDRHLLKLIETRHPPHMATVAAQSNVVYGPMERPRPFPPASEHEQQDDYLWGV